MSSADPGSFRDPASRVLVADDRVLRLLDNRGLRAWEALASTDFFTRAVADGKLIPSAVTEAPEYQAAAVLEHLVSRKPLDPAIIERVRARASSSFPIRTRSSVPDAAKEASANMARSRKSLR